MDRVVEIFLVKLTHLLLRSEGGKRGERKRDREDLHHSNQLFSRNLKTEFPSLRRKGETS